MSHEKQPRNQNNRARASFLATIALSSVLSGSGESATGNDVVMSDTGLEVPAITQEQKPQTANDIPRLSVARRGLTGISLVNPANLDACAGEVVIESALSTPIDQKYLALRDKNIQAFRPIEDVIDSLSTLYIFRPGVSGSLLLSDVYEGSYRQEALANATTVEAIVNDAVGPILQLLPEEARPTYILIGQADGKLSCVPGATVQGGEADIADDTIAILINPTGVVNAADLFDVAAHEAFHFLFTHIAEMQGNDGKEFEYEPYFVLDDYNEIYAKVARLDSYWMGKFLSLILEDNTDSLSPDDVGIVGMSLGTYCFPARVNYGIESGDTTFKLFTEYEYTANGFGGHPSTAPEELFASTANILRTFPETFMQFVNALPNDQRKAAVIEAADAVLTLTARATSDTEEELRAVYGQGIIDFISSQKSQLSDALRLETESSSSYCYYDLVEKTLKDELGMVDIVQPSQDDSLALVSDTDRSHFRRFMTSVSAAGKDSFSQSAWNIRMNPAVGAFEALEWQDLFASLGAPVNEEWMNPVRFVEDFKRIVSEGGPIDRQTALQIITHPAFVGDDDPAESQIAALAEIHKYTYEDLLTFSSRQDVSGYYNNGPAQMLSIIESQSTDDEIRVIAQKLRTLLEGTRPYEVLPATSYETINHWLATQRAEAIIERQVAGTGQAEG